MRTALILMASFLPPLAVAADKTDGTPGAEVRAPRVEPKPGTENEGAGRQLNGKRPTAAEANADCEASDTAATEPAAARIQTPSRLVLQRPAWLAETRKSGSRVLRIDRLESVSTPDGTEGTRREVVEVTEGTLTRPGLKWHGDLALGVGTDHAWDTRVRVWTTIRDCLHLGLSVGAGRYRWPERDRWP